MRYLVSPEFTAKAAALASGDINRVVRFLKLIEASDRQELIDSEEAEITLLGESVYLAKLGSTRLYLTFAQDNDGEYLLILDATAESQDRGGTGALFALKDPKTNSALNPSLNTSINPRFNTALNPKFNTSINPRFNTALNPKFNTSINPRFNTSINPRFNTTLNPRFNSSLNPRFNTAINPRMNRAFGGPYLYSIKLDQMGYLVRANDLVDLLFDPQGNHIGQLVRVNSQLQAQFDEKGVWSGYMVRANDDVALHFTTAGDWSGLLI